jgi:hypothetical protein
MDFPSFAAIADAVISDDWQRRQVAGFVRSRTNIIVGWDL